MGSDVAPSWGPTRLAAVEAEFFALRARPADLPAAFLAGVEEATAGAVPEDLRAAGMLLANVVTRTTRPLLYHNAHHFAETTLVMGWMCRLALNDGKLHPRNAALGVIAMVGHDYLHDGAPPDGGRLEALAADASLKVLHEGGRGLSDPDAAVVRAVILGTDPTLVKENAARAAGKAPTGPLGEDVDLLIALANEADVFASFLPDMGPRQSLLLAREWSAGGHLRSMGVMGFANRLAFLRTYDRLTPMSRRMGVAELRARQFAAFTCGGGLLDLGGTPEEGAAALDALEPEEARERFTACLRDMAPKGS
jgi:hypothetical protein